MCRFMCHFFLVTFYARWSGSKKTVSPYNIKTYGTMGSEGFEPTKAEPTDLQSAPFDHSGNSPFNRHYIYIKE